MKTKFITTVLFYFIKILSKTYKIQYINLENKIKAKNLSENKTFIYAIWHQSIFTPIISHQGEIFTMMISPSRDGEIAASICKRFGHIPIRGSSSREGKKALLEIIKAMKKGIPAAMAVDGPKGPAFKVKPGIIEMAKLTNSPILPFSTMASAYWEFNSWDKFRIPKPFSKINIIFGEPIIIPEKISKHEFQKITESITEIMLKNDK